MGVSRILAFPEVVLFRVPEALTAAGPHDPMILGVDPARNCLHIYAVFLQLWRRGEIGSGLDGVLAAAAAEPPAVATRAPMPH